MNLFAQQSCPVEVFIQAPDGGTHGPIDCRISPADNTIRFLDSCLVITTTDKILRALPNGEIERYDILESVFSPSVTDLPAYWELKVRKQKKDLANNGSDSPPANGALNPAEVGDRKAQVAAHAVNYLKGVIGNSEASVEEKIEAQRRLAEFLEHPVVSTILGDIQ